MRIGVLGTGVVGRTLASKLVSLGHEVMMGSRRAGNEAAAAWAEENGQLADEGSFAEAAGFGELIVNATAGSASLDALVSAEAENLAGKVLTDLYSGDDEAWRGLTFYQQPYPRIPPEPFRWIGYQTFTRLTGKSPRI